MSFAKITEINNHFVEKYGSGIEEIVVESKAFDLLLLDATARLRYDQDSLGKYELSTNLKFYVNDEPILITRSVRDKIRETEDQIIELQEKITRLKTKTGY